MIQYSRLICQFHVESVLNILFHRLYNACLVWWSGFLIIIVYCNFTLHQITSSPMGNEKLEIEINSTDDRI